MRTRNLGEVAGRPLHRRCWFDGNPPVPVPVDPVPVDPDAQLTLAGLPMFPVQAEPSTSIAPVTTRRQVLRACRPATARRWVLRRA